MHLTYFQLWLLVLHGVGTMARDVREVIELQGVTSYVSLVVPSDGKAFVTADNRFNITMWDLERPGKSRTINLGGNRRPYLLVGTTESASVLAAIRGFNERGEDRCEIHRLCFKDETSRKLTAFDGHALAFGQDKVVAIRDHPQSLTIQCHDLTSGKRMSVGCPGKRRVLQATFSPDGSCLVALGDTDVLTAWDYPSGKKRWHRSVPSKSTSSRFFFSSAGNKLIWPRASYCEILDVDTGEVLLNEVRGLPKVIHPNGHCFVDHDHDGNGQYFLVFRKMLRQERGEARNYNEVARIGYRLDGGACRFLAFTPDGGRLIGAGAYGQIRVWKTPDLGK